jgi:hypothetical protein
LRDSRAKSNPGLWDRSPGGTPISRPFPAGGKIPAEVYHDKGHFTPMPETRPMPTK